MKLRNCLIALAVITILLYSGVQAVFIMQGNLAPEAFALDADFEASGGDNMVLDGGGGDPVPGPGIPK